MKKNILGLDLGTTSIGWAYVQEAETPEQSSIQQIGVRVNPLTSNELMDFEKGKPLATNAARTLKRGARRNLDRYQLRRKNLLEVLLKAGIIDRSPILAEDGKGTTFETWQLRAKAAEERVQLEQFARILFSLNKKRGYKSSRKAKNVEDGQAIDGMSIAKRLYEEKLTPGQLSFQQLMEGKKTVPEFYRSDLQAEFDKVWETQSKYHKEVLTLEFYNQLKGKGHRASAALFWTKYGFNIAEIKDVEDNLKTRETIEMNLREKKRLQSYKWRNDAITQKLSLEQAAHVICEINNNLYTSSGYLGAISDRSKELYFHKETIGQNQYRQLLENPHAKLKNQVFYRQDYLDEFEKIWNVQAKYHTELTPELKTEIRDIVIFYQRKLKSQKGLIAFCEFESKEVKIDGKKKTIGSRVAPKSSPLFQEFKIWQNINNILIKRKGSRKRKIAKDQMGQFESDPEIFSLDFDAKQLLFDELNLKGALTAKQAIEILGYNPQDWEINYSRLEGNNTNKVLYAAYLRIIEDEGYDVRTLFKFKTIKDEYELADLAIPSHEIKKVIKDIFEVMGVDTAILNFNAELDGKEFEQQPAYQIWHLLYSFEGDDSKSGNEKLFQLLEKKFRFKSEAAKRLANISFQDDYSNISSKAMRKIYPYIKENIYSKACELAGYRHSKSSLTKEELEDRPLKNELDLLQKNSLRNPVVEKILNQMINVVNALIYKNSKKDEQGNVIEYFRFDEIRIELARELKKNASERAEMTSNVNAAKLKNEKIVKILQTEFGITNPTRNDIIRFRLYEELKNNGYKDLYTETYIPREILFSKEIDIEHIIPQSRLFDDSFSNKTIVYRKDNLAKGNQTAFDYINSKYNEERVDAYQVRVEKLFELGKKNIDDGISKAKYKKLLMRQAEIGDGFIERDLRETQYIAKKAKEILFEITPSVVSTSGSITGRLREDWGLINLMKEVNLPKFRMQGMTEMEERKYGQKVEVIKDWTKRNDHRHHAIDALVIAFTKHNHIQYLNYLNARKNDNHKLHKNIMTIEAQETELQIDANGERKRLFKAPMPHFRQEARIHLESVLVSHKAKNKVATRNKNRISGKIEYQNTITPRGQLHKETVYGKYSYSQIKEERVGGKFDSQMIEKVTSPVFRKLLLERLEEYNGDPKMAFTGRNSLIKNPIYLNGDKVAVLPERVRVIDWAYDYSIRKDITPDNFNNEKAIDKILDKGVREILRKRLSEFEGDFKKAFSDLDNNPIWLNKLKGISIKRVTISGMNNAVPLNYKKNNLGQIILDKDGHPVPVDYVSTGNNHHVAIYRDQDGNLQDRAVSFFEAVERVNQQLPVIDKWLNQHLGWQFLFTLKQNEFFVFPRPETGFNPHEIDLLRPENKKIISPNLFRVQTISVVKYGNNSVRDFKFRHHLESMLIDDKNMRGVTYYQVKSLPPLEGIVKVRLNHIGDIVEVGEY